MELSSFRQSSSSSSSIVGFLRQRLSNLVIITVFLLLLPTELSGANAPGNITIPAIIVFGDSIVDQGNNNHLKTLAKCNFPPYGDDFVGGKPTGRFSNGKTPADILAEEFGIKEFVPAYLDPNLQDKDLLTGVSFASGATGLDLETSKLLSVLSMPKQLELLKEYIGKLKGIVGEEGTKEIFENSLFVVVVGSNDLTNTYFTLGLRRLQYNIESYTDLLVRSASEFLEGLYKLGARRVAIHGVPPIGCMPSQRTLKGGILRKCEEKYNVAAQLLNKKMSNAVSSFQNRQSDSKSRVFFVDLYSPTLDLIQNYTKYGFEEADEGCCGTGKVEASIFCNKLSKTCRDHSTYLFWDSFHPTERGYRVLVGKIFQTYIDNLQRPPNS